MWLTCWITNNTHTHIQRYLLLLLDTISLLKLVILSSDYDPWYIVNLSRFIMGQYTFYPDMAKSDYNTSIKFFGYHGHFNSFAFSYNIYVIFL